MDRARAVIGILSGVPCRRTLFSGLLVGVLVASAVALSACGGADGASDANASPAAAVEPLPTRNPRAKAVEPVAGESAAYADLPAADPDDQPKAGGASAPLPKLRKGNGPTSDAAISNADVLKNGIALPPIEAPEEVRLIIEAGNQIARTPYLWGGGHGKWLDHGYDCSGSVSFALANAGLLAGPQTSGALQGWGAPGTGKWITVYANSGHVFMVVAGVRFDTSGNRKTGSRWQSDMRSTGGFVARHPRGL
ncbi:MAG: peptidoglycan DL-endopeptidase RipB [Solirubrobacteraceae bacterium]|jgi:cell wall-associated NlpC family hydrolase|nr:peptidoglycan DL-endopeptidase RipB [Solirubrobacteraceae bacterium]